MIPPCALPSSLFDFPLFRLSAPPRTHFRKLLELIKCPLCNTPADAWHGIKCQRKTTKMKAGRRRAERGREREREREKTPVRQAVGNAIVSSPALVITQWLNQLTPLNDGRGRRATPPAQHSLGRPVAAWLVALVALAWFCWRLQPHQPHQRSSKTKSQIKLLLQHATCNMQQKWRQCQPLLCCSRRRQTDNQSHPSPSSSSSSFPASQVRSY